MNRATRLIAIVCLCTSLIYIGCVDNKTNESSNENSNADTETETDTNDNTNIDAGAGVGGLFPEICQFEYAPNVIETYEVLDGASILISEKNSHTPTMEC